MRSRDDCNVAYIRDCIRIVLDTNGRPARRLTKIGNDFLFFFLVSGEKKRETKKNQLRNRDVIN